MNVDQALKLVLGSGVVYAIAAACGSGSGGGGGSGGHGGPVPDAMADVNQSGSRLKAQYVSGADGSKTFIGMYDTQTKHECAYAFAADGMTRCLPFGPLVVQSTIYYGDMGCTQPILNVPKTCTTPPPYVSTAETTCGGNTSFHVYPSGAAFTPGAMIYLITGSGTSKACTGIKPAMGADWVATGKEIAASTFVEGTVMME
jgi:hypothetical protein